MAITYPAPPLTPPSETAECTCNCACSCGSSSTTTAASSPTNPGCADGKPVTAIGTLTDQSTTVGVLAGSGLLRKDATDVKSAGFGSPLAHTRVYNNANPAFDSGQGTGWMVFQWSYLVQNEDSSITVVRGTQGTIWFGPPTSGTGHSVRVPGPH